MHAAVIIPAHDEEDTLPACLDALAEQEIGEDLEVDLEIVLAANGCTDATVAIAETYCERFQRRGWRLTVLDLPVASKARALNAADRAAGPGARIHLDADTLIGPKALDDVLRALAEKDAIFVTGSLSLTVATSLATRLYGKALMRMPYFANGDSGAGFFAVNAAGRERWSEIPDIIADDVFIRAHFGPNERRRVAAQYSWPLPEGWRAVVRVRRRQEVGLRQLRRLRRDLVESPDAPCRLPAWLGLSAKQPIAATMYLAIVGIAKLTANSADTNWARGR